MEKRKLLLLTLSSDSDLGNLFPSPLLFPSRFSLCLLFFLRFLHSLALLELNFDASDETARGRDLRGRGRGTPRGELRTMGLVRTGMKSWVVVSTPGIVCDCGGVLFHCVGGRKGLLPTPDEFPRFEGGRKPDSWDGNREPGRAVELLVP